MAVHNGMPHVQDAVESILAQTLAEWRFVIVDDGSTDDTHEYLATLADPRITVLRQANAGLAGALNRGLELCNADFVARMDADDISAPERLEAQVNFLDNNPSVGLVGSQVAWMGAARHGRSLQLPVDNDSIVSALNRGQHALCHSSLLMRTEHLRSIGGYWESGIAEDWDMYLRMAEVTQLANVDRLIHFIRVHDESLTAGNVAETRTRIEYACDRAHRRREGLPAVSYSEFRQTRDQNAEARGFEREVRARTYYRRGLIHSLNGRRAAGIANMALAGLLAPSLAADRALRHLRGALRSEPGQHAGPGPVYEDSERIAA